MENFRQGYCAPWEQEGPSHDGEQLRQEMLNCLEGLGYGEDQWSHDRAWLLRLVHYAGLETYPNRGYPAISLGAG